MALQALIVSACCSGAIRGWTDALLEALHCKAKKTQRT